MIDTPKKYADLINARDNGSITCNNNFICSSGNRIDLFFNEKTSDNAVALIKKRYEGQILGEFSFNTQFRCYGFVMKDEFVIQNNQNSFIAFGTQNTKKYKSTSLLIMQKDDADKICEFIVAHAPHIQILQK